MDTLTLIAFGVAVLFLVAIYVVAVGAAHLHQEEQVDARKAWDNLLNQSSPEDPAGVLPQARKIISRHSEAVEEAERVLSTLWSKL